MQNDDLFVSWTDNTEFVVMCLKVKKKKKYLFYLPCVFRILTFIHLSPSCKPNVTYVRHLEFLVFPVYTVTFRDQKATLMQLMLDPDLATYWILSVI